MFGIIRLSGPVNRQAVLTEKGKYTQCDLESGRELPKSKRHESKRHRGMQAWALQFLWAKYILPNGIRPH